MPDPNDADRLRGPDASDDRPVRLDPQDPLGAGFAEAVGQALARFGRVGAAELRATSPELDELARLALEAAAVGKRLRPAFCVWGYAAVGGSLEAPGGSAAAGALAQAESVRVADDSRPLAAPGELIRAAAALELLHAAELVHDDVIDGSATRHGRAAAHVQFARWHADAGGLGDSAAFGRAAAVLLGDLLLKQAYECFWTSGFDQASLRRAAPHWFAVEREVTAGQYLDLAAQTRDPLWLRREPAAGLALIEQVVEHKTARYTCLRPLLIGAALAGSNPAADRALEAFGSALGRAFQYRDDVLGVFGDPAVTGKPAGDDIREGKLTVLVARAMSLVDEADARRLAGWLGSPAADVAAAGALIESCGARQAVEDDIRAAHRQAVSALADAPIDDAGRRALLVLADTCVNRSA
ncbi:MAG: polyprenyl synthetase family protein [Propionibacteriaceae bacterium]|jgi:geranylgeranyl diphosphate synthase type I|nr:polyprenyl synthetase family protein [Propionibacteriaceae bacterium]